MRENEISGIVIACAIEVHRALGPGLLESVYEECLVHELRQRGLTVERQKALPIVYKGIQFEEAYRIDLVVGGSVIVELKCVLEILPVHEAQLLTYLRLSGLQVGLLLNFKVPVMKQGIRRLVHEAPF